MPSTHAQGTHCTFLTGKAPPDLASGPQGLSPPRNHARQRHSIALPPSESSSLSPRNKAPWLVNREVNCCGKAAATRQGSSFLSYSPDADARLHQSPGSWVVRTKPPTAAAATHPMPVLAESSHHLPRARREGAGRELAQGSEAATRAAWKAHTMGQCVTRPSTGPGDGRGSTLLPLSF